MHDISTPPYPPHTPHTSLSATCGAQIGAGLMKKKKKTTFEFIYLFFFLFFFDVMIHSLLYYDMCILYLGGIQFG